MLAKLLKRAPADPGKVLYTQLQASGYFDSAWYRLAYQDQIEFPQDLLYDYVRAGIASGRDPSPYFNTILYLRENDVLPEQAVMHFLDSGRAMASGAYRNPSALLSAQHEFQIKTQTKLIDDRRHGTRPFAVYLQCGGGALLDHWQHPDKQSWHLLINHYDSTYIGKIPCEVEFCQAGVLPGTKFTSFLSILTQQPQILAPYEYVLLLDDDVLFQEDGINQLFSVIQDHGWDMAQASLSTDSHGSFEVFNNPGRGGWRQVNGVEIMMPVFSTRFMKVIQYLIGMSISGWGFDTALASVAKERGFRAAVVDDVIASHTKPINADIGQYYQMLHQADIYPEIEFTHLQKMYGFVRPLFFEIRPSGK